MLAQILATDAQIEVVGTARDGREAVEAVPRLKPDLITMDIHMPRMDGLEATEEIMAYHPTPILVVSSSVHGEGMGRAFDALKMGALEVIKKPEPRDWAELEKIGRDVIGKVKLLSRVTVITHIRGRRGSRPLQAPPIRITEPVSTRSIIAIGSSTGGPTALLAVLAPLPANLPVPIVIAQHIAEGFIPGLVSWLGTGTKLVVEAAQDGLEASAGVAYLAPTGLNLVVDGGIMRFSRPQSGQLYVPSADTLFASVASSYGARGIGVILTGMGADGAVGMKAMRDAGAATIAQDESSCTVYGMPKAAVEADATSVVLPLTDIAGQIMSELETRAR